MTSDLITRLKKAVEFDDNRSRYVMPKLYEHIWRPDLWSQAQEKENGRLRAIIDPLIDVASGLERWRDAWASQDTSDAEPARKAMLAALARLERAVGK